MKGLFFLNSEAFEMMNLETQEPLVSSPGRIRPIIEDDLGAPVPIHVRVWLRGKGGTFAFKLISAFENKQLKKILSIYLAAPAQSFGTPHLFVAAC